MVRGIADRHRVFELYYEAASWFYLIAPFFIAAALFIIKAPFGRFSPEGSRFTVDGVVGWMIMESVSPVTFLMTYLSVPFSPTGKPPPLDHPSTLLAILFIVHYLNRAIISPLRSPGRSRIHLVVIFAAIIFNMINPCLMAAFLSAPNHCPCPWVSRPPESYSPLVQTILSYVPMTEWANQKLVCKTMDAERPSWTSPTLVFGLLIWFIGFASNILHDEILYDLRRNSSPNPNGKHKYSIPHGYLYEYISYPNYFSEWIEWTGFALAASPHWSYTPPWMFVIAEVCVMAPRAFKGHDWYLERFPDYPRNRKVIIPFIL